MDWLTNPEAWIAFTTLLSLEIVLGVDNVIFIAILAGKLPRAQQNKARLVGLALAMLMRIGLLFSITWVMSLQARLFTLFEYDVSGRDLVLIAGGLFLLGKATFEIHGKLEGASEHRSGKPAASFASVIIQV